MRTDETNSGSPVSSPSELPESTGLEQPFLVFISYRVHPDQPLAIALKELIEGAIEPEPRVFVSGAGGLRPSSIGSKPQIQAAVQTARAFIAIITQQSKDREWIFFEAGAAWGRNQLYSPLLVDTAPSELASSIADYQAIRASDRDEVERLISAIAEAIGGTVRSRFSNRYRAFQKRLQAYNATSADEGPEDDRSPLGQAIDLLKRGELDASNDLFAKLENNALSKEEKTQIRISKLINSGLKNNEILHALETVEEQYDVTSISQYWLGFFQNRPPASIRHYSSCLELLKVAKDENTRRNASAGRLLMVPQN